jgi:serine/threonine-protein kinase
MTRLGKCPAAALTALVEGRLAPAQEDELADHLDACTHCRQELAGQRLGLPPELHPARTPLPHLAHEEALEQAMRELKTGPHQSVADVSWQVDLLGEPWTLGRLGRYEVEEVIGRGGMGVVLRAYDPALDRPVAIKALAPHLAASAAARRRFAREGRAIGALRHEHIVTVYGVDEAEGLPCLVMEYVRGVSLQERVDAGGPLPVEEVVRIGTQVARGLAAAHAHGLVHRDVKPANILLEEDTGSVKITDFGLARAVDDASLTSSGVINGTPLYMAPEQARDEPLDHRADLFSLGSVLYTLCVGEPAFRATSTPAVLRRICEEQPQPLRQRNPEVPAWLEQFIDVLLAKDPGQRFASAEEAARLLELYRQHRRHPRQVPPPALPGRPRPPRGRGPYWVAGLVLLLFLAGAAGFALARKDCELTTCCAKVTPPAPAAPRIPPTIHEYAWAFSRRGTDAPSLSRHTHVAVRGDVHKYWTVHVVGPEPTPGPSACPPPGPKTIVLRGDWLSACRGWLPLRWAIPILAEIREAALAEPPSPPCAQPPSPWAIPSWEKLVPQPIRLQLRGPQGVVLDILLQPDAAPCATPAPSTDEDAAEMARCFWDKDPGPMRLSAVKATRPAARPRSERRPVVPRCAATGYTWPDARCEPPNQS